MSERRACESPEVLIIGGGVMGCAAAFVLARSGARVVVLERSVIGAEASSKAAGMLAAQLEAHAPGPFASLCLAGRARFATLSEELREATGIDVEYRKCGVLRAASSEQELARVVEETAWHEAVGAGRRVLSENEARALEPGLGERVVGGVLFEEDARVDPPKLLRALRIAAERAGASFRTGATVARVSPEPRPAVLLSQGETLHCEHLVVAAGSWTPLIEGAPLARTAIVPARGQIVELACDVPPQRSVLCDGDIYLSPRDDGRVLVGSTLEFVGFRTGVTASAIARLLGAAARLLPALGEAEVTRFWSSFRPHTQDELPYIGESGFRNVWLASGHFRNGILLSGITADCLAALIAGHAPPLELEPFSGTRVSPAPSSRS